MNPIYFHLHHASGRVIISISLYPYSMMVIFFIAFIDLHIWVKPVDVIGVQHVCDNGGHMILVSSYDPWGTSRFPALTCNQTTGSALMLA